MPNFELKKKTKEEHDYVRTIIPEYFENKSLQDKLNLLDFEDQSELDNNQSNLILDDSFSEMDSLSNLDQEQIKMIPLDKRLSMLIRRESIIKKEKYQHKSSLQKNASANLPIKFKNISAETQISTGMNNEKLLDVLDDMEDNLIDNKLNFSFTRISLLDLADRCSIIHGPSFKGNMEMTSQVSKRKSSKCYIIK